MNPATQIAISQLDDLLKRWDAVPIQGNHHAFKTDKVLFIRLKDAIRRHAPNDSAHQKAAAREVNLLPLGHIAKALREDYANGYLQTVGEIIHAEVFSDFLEAAEHLLEQGYKDAAAVMAGGTLESHIRQLCTKWGVPVERTKPDESNEPKKADAMNADLKAIGAYDTNTQKQVTSMLALRNSAAHGHYDKYDNARVNLFISEVRHLIMNHPA